jgi:hypothetical protein
MDGTQEGRITELDRNGWKGKHIIMEGLERKK